MGYFLKNRYGCIQYVAECFDKIHKNASANIWNRAE